MTIKRIAHCACPACTGYVTEMSTPCYLCLKSCSSQQGILQALSTVDVRVKQSLHLHMLTTMIISSQACFDILSGLVSALISLSLVSKVLIAKQSGCFWLCHRNYLCHAGKQLCSQPEPAQPAGLHPMSAAPRLRDDVVLPNTVRCNTPHHR